MSAFTGKSFYHFLCYYRSEFMGKILTENVNHFLWKEILVYNFYYNYLVGKISEIKE